MRYASDRASRCRRACYTWFRRPFSLRFLLPPEKLTKASLLGVFFASVNREGGHSSPIAPAIPVPDRRLLRYISASSRASLHSSPYSALRAFVSEAPAEMIDEIAQHSPFLILCIAIDSKRPPTPRCTRTNHYSHPPPNVSYRCTSDCASPSREFTRFSCAEKRFESVVRTSR
jgi:hypothetical protein